MDGGSEGCSPTNTETLQKLAVRLCPAGGDAPVFRDQSVCYLAFKAQLKFRFPPGSLPKMFQFSQSPLPSLSLLLGEEEKPRRGETRLG
jgi:hypothetical protein